MKSGEAKQIMKLVVAAWPSPAITAETVIVYAEGLADLDAVTVAEAIKSLVMTEDFRPSVAKVRRTAAIVTSGAPVAQDALREAEMLVDWQQTNRVAIGAGRVRDAPEVHRFVVEAVAMAGEDFHAPTFMARYREILANLGGRSEMLEITGG